MAGLLILMLKTILSFQVLIANEFDNIKSGKLIEKFIEPKSRSLFKSRKSKNNKLDKPKKLSKSENLFHLNAKRSFNRL